MAPIKIGIDARFAGISQGGIGRYVEHTVRELLKLATPWNYVIFLRKNGWNIFDNVLREGDKKVLADIPWYGAEEQLRLPYILRSHSCDAFHYPHFNVPYAAPRPFVMTLHDMIMWEEGRARDTTHQPLKARCKELGMRVTVRRALTRAHAWVTPTAWVKERVERIIGISSVRGVVIPEGADALAQVTPATWGALKDAWGIDAKYFLMVGSAYRHKGNDLVLRAMAQARSMLPEYKLIHAGPAHPSSFHSQLLALGEKLLGDRYRHVGEVSNEALATLYQHAEAYVSASCQEGFGLPALEALQQGTPAIVPRATCFPEVLGDAAHYFTLGNTDELCRTMVTLARSPSLRKRLCAQGIQHAKQYTWKQHAQALIPLYGSIMGVTSSLPRTR